MLVPDGKRLLDTLPPKIAEDYKKTAETVRFHAASLRSVSTTVSS